MQLVRTRSTTRLPGPLAAMLISLGLSAATAADDRAPPAAPAAPAALTLANVLQQSTPADWRPLDPQNTLYLDLPQGRVIIELAPRFAPLAIANIKQLAHEHFYDRLSVERVQDNYVAQWGSDAKPLGAAAARVPAEFSVSGRDLPWVSLPDPDTYAPLTGFSDGFPAGRDVTTGQAWLTHCYGMVGVGRDNDVDTGNGSELYAVIGQAPRHLDRNITLVGRVVQGMELLSALPRGSAPMGFYADPKQGAVIRRLVLAADLPAGQRVALEELRTDSQAFAQLVAARRNRAEEWYKVPAGRIDVCNVPVPVREPRP